MSNTDVRPQWERLPSLFAYIEKLTDEGMDEAAIAEHLVEIDQYEWDCILDKMREEGVPDEQVAQWILDLLTDRMNFNDDEPEDAVDASDPGYKQPKDKGAVDLTTVLVILLIIIALIFLVRMV
jgi:hypothetical protein